MRARFSWLSGARVNAMLSIRVRLFLILAGLSLAIILAANAVWLPSSIRETRENQEQLRRLAVRAGHFHIEQFLLRLDRALDRAALQAQIALLLKDQAALRGAIHKILQQQPELEEIGILNADGRQIARESRRLMASDVQSRASPFALAARSQRDRVLWGPVVLSDASEPWVTVGVRRALGGTKRSITAYGVVNLKRLNRLTEAIEVGSEGKLRVVDGSGQLIAATDPSVVLKRTSLIDRPMIKTLLGPGATGFITGTYTDERGVEVTATGMALAPAGWGVVFEQPQSLLFAPIRRKIWISVGLSSTALVFSLWLAHIISRRFTRPILRLQEGADRIAAGQLDHRVTVARGDEIGRLAQQFNRMANELQASYREMEQKVAERSHEIAALSTAIAPLAPMDSIQQVFQGVIERISSVTGADSALIRILDRKTNSFVVIAQRAGFSPDYVIRARGFRPDSAIAQVFSSGQPIISENIRTDARIRAKEQMRLGINSCAFLPLVAGGEVRGVIHLASRTTGFFKENRREYLMAIARLMGIVVENNELLQFSVRNAEELRRSNRELEQFAYVASHDLQEPLRMVAGFTQLLAKRYQGKLDDDADQFINFAVDGAKRMQELIQDLLAYSRVGTSASPFTAVDCNALIESVLSGLKAAVDEARATVTYGSLATVRGDETQIRQLLQNLIGNAVKYHDSKPPRVHLACTRLGDMWRFAVEDNGIGIDPQHIERIFVIFQRLHTHKEYPGTGIGLALCKKIVERHGGGIWVESEPGNGSKFFFTLPA